MATRTPSDYGNVGGGSPLVLTFGAGVPSTDSIYVAMILLNKLSSPGTVTDNGGAGNVYNVDVEVQGTGAGTLDWFYVFRCDNPGGNPTVVTVPNTSRGMKGVAYHCTGMAGGVYDVAQVRTEAANTLPSAAFTTGFAGEVAIACMSTNNGGSGKDFLANVDSDVSWQLDSTSVGEVAWFMSAITGAAGTLHADGTLSANNGLWDEFIVTYKAASTAPTLSAATVTAITDTTATPRVTITF